MLSEEKIKKLIADGRAFMRRQVETENEEYKTDQYLMKPQPPLFKEPMSDRVIALPKEFESLPINNNFLEVINSRVSNRFYTEEKMSLTELSYLCWCAQGVKGLRGKKYATLRTVPCGGARHEFELYMAVRGVEGLSNGYYHYMPDRHAVELLREESNPEEFISASLEGQKWGAKANVVFYISMVAYRAEWRYGISSHRVALMDSGYISENIYLACTSIGMGSCAIGAVDTDLCDEKFKLDGTEEFIFLAHAVGKIRAEDRDKELDFYAFIKDFDN